MQSTGSFRNIGILVNTESGSAHETVPDEIDALLSEEGVRGAKTWTVGGSELDAALREAGTDRELLIIFGGDGTINTAARYATWDGPALIPLPGGTLNMLPRALYGDLTWQETLRMTFRGPSMRAVSGGRAGSERFFIAALVGGPARFAEAREAFRKGEIREAAKKSRDALEETLVSDVRFEFDAMSGTAEAIAVLCPLISKALPGPQKAFEAAVIHVERVNDLARMATAAAFGEWRENEKIETAVTAAVNVFSDTDIPVILDGETTYMASPLRVTFVSKAFRAVVPAALPRPEGSV